MKLQIWFIVAVLTTAISACTVEKTIKLPLTYHNGYGYFKMGLGGLITYSEGEKNPWKKTYLSVQGVPQNWTEVKKGDIETNIYQSLYQNYLLGNITKEKYEEIQKSWNWAPDTLELSKEPIKTKIAFAYGKDSTGTTHIIIDANNNLDFSDDKSFVPYNISLSENKNKDSLILENAIMVSYESFVNHKKQMNTVPLVVVNLTPYNMLMYNFPQYATTRLAGKKIAVCSDQFINLSYQNPSIVVVPDTIKKGDKIKNEWLISKNEYLEIKDQLFKNKGVSFNDNALVLENMSVPKSELYSTQVGFKSFPFEGEDFISGSKISSEQLKGKYVLLDFWAVWCGPCLEEFPEMKKLYAITGRDQFEIIGVVGKSPEKYLQKIIEKDSLPWPQIRVNETDTIEKIFGIQGYPTTYLIDPKGVILAKNISGEELEKKVLELLGKNKNAR